MVVVGFYITGTRHWLGVKVGELIEKERKAFGQQLIPEQPSNHQAANGLVKTLGGGISAVGSGWLGE